MANELIWKTTSQVALQTSGASMASNAGPVSVGTLATSSHLNYPLVDAAMYASFTGAVASGSSVMLYARYHDIDGTSDAPALGASYLSRFVGAFPVPGSTAAATAVMFCPDIPTAPLPIEFYVDNKTNQAIAAGWTLKVTPRTQVPSA